MPEGDTVRRTAQELDSALRGTFVHHAELRWPSLATADLTGWRTVDVCSVGKHLLQRFDSGMTLHSHRRMEGRWTIAAPTTTPPRDHRARVILLAGPADEHGGPGPEPTVMAVGWSLGVLHLVASDAEHQLIGHLGPDLLDDAWIGREAELTEEVGHRLARAPERMIADALLDQTTVAGLGTMWVSDLLFLQRTNPGSRVAEVTDISTLVRRARTALLRAVELGVSTSTPSTRRGQTTWTHGRSGHPCRRCGTAVRLWLTADHGRTVFYCPQCQGGLAPGDDGRTPAPWGARRRSR